MTHFAPADGLYLSRLGIVLIFYSRLVDFFLKYASDIQSQIECGYFINIYPQFFITTAIYFCYYTMLQPSVLCTDNINIV